MYKKTILFLDQYPNLSGGQKVLLDIIQAFSRKKYRCIAILPQKGLLSESLVSMGTKTIFLPIGYYNITRKNVFDFLNYLIKLPILMILLINLIRREKIDLAYANGARTFIWVTFVCSIARVPLVWHIHSIFDRGIARKVCLSFGKFAIVKKIFVVSKVAARPLKELNPKLEIIYNAIKEPQLSRDINILKKEYHFLSENVFLVGNVGILEEWKNQMDLILAAKVIRDSGKKGIYFFLVGDSLYTKYKRQGYKYKLKRLVRYMHLEKEVIFTGFRKDVFELLNSMDVLVICSKDPDPCPMVSLEAAALAIPMISSDIGGVKEMFEEGKEALFYKAGGFEDLASKIIYLSENRQMLQTIGQNALIKIRREHNLDNYLERIVDTVETTCLLT